MFLDKNIFNSICDIMLNSKKPMLGKLKKNMKLSLDSDRTSYLRNYLQNFTQKKNRYMKKDMVKMRNHGLDIKRGERVMSIIMRHPFTFIISFRKMHSSNKCQVIKWYYKHFLYKSYSVTHLVL